MANYIIQAVDEAVPDLDELLPTSAGRCLECYQTYEAWRRPDVSAVHWAKF